MRPSYLPFPRTNFLYSCSMVHALYAIFYLLSLHLYTQEILQLFIHFLH